MLIVLVLANLLALAWWQGWFAHWELSSGAAGIRAAEVAPERLRVVPMERIGAGMRSRSTSPAQVPAAADASGTPGDASAGRAIDPAMPADRPLQAPRP